MATQAPERDPDVVTFAAFNGLRSDVPAERFDSGDLHAAINVDLDKSGQVSRRGGFTSLAAGAMHSAWSDRRREIAMVVRAGGLYRISSGIVFSLVTTLANPDAPMAYERVDNRVYFSNGTDSGVYEDGAARSWGLPVPPLPGVAAIAGNMPAGTYQFALSYLRADGQESGTRPLAGLIELPASGGIQFTLPVSTHPEVVGKVLYLSSPNGEVLREAAAVANGLTGLTWLSDPGSLSELLQVQGLSAPPAGQRVAFYRGYMFVAAGDTLYVSEPYSYEMFDLRRYLQLDGRITLLAPFSDKDRSDSSRDSGFFVGTDHSCGVLAGTNPSDFQYVPKTDYGAIPGALDYVDGSLFHQGETGARALPMWLTTQGVCVGMPDLLINNLTRAKFTFPAAGRGAALFMPGPKRFLATANL